MKKYQKKLLNETITKRMLRRGECIISKLQASGEFEWLSSQVALEMDQEYYLGVSGYKPISILYHNLLKDSETFLVSQTDDDSEIVGTTLTPDVGCGIITSSDEQYKDAIDKIVPIIINKYGDKWNRLWDAFVTATYNPIENYSMQEHTIDELDSHTDDDLVIDGENKHSGTITSQHTGTDELAKGTSNTKTLANSHTDTFNDTHTNTETGSVKNEIEGTPVDSVYPSFTSSASPIKQTAQDTEQTTTFNNHVNADAHTGSVTGADSGTITDAQSGKDTQTLNLTDTNTFNDKVEQDNTNTRDIDVDSSREITHTRSGNIGVTTSQQMLQSEIDLRNNFNMINQIYKDIDSIVTQYVW